MLEPSEPGPAWAPFGGSRPLAELRAGAWRIRERWEAALDAETVALLSDSGTDFHELDEPRTRAIGPIAGPAVVARSDFAPGGRRPALGTGLRRLTHGAATVAWIVADGERWSGPASETVPGDSEEIDGLVLRGAFDLVGALERFLPDDCGDFVTRSHDDIPSGSLVLGDPTHVISLGAVVEPGVVFDVRHGAVVLEHAAEVRHGTRLEGPCYVGAGTRVLGGFVRSSAFGPRCSARGEISASTFLGYANKSHDGFVGHSVIGQWVNLGAGTTTSNLKNTYGPVRLDVAGRRIETDRTFLGSLIGDHAKTAIGTLLSTGTVVGTGASLFGDGATPKYVPPFAWGSHGTERLSEDGFLRIAERVLPRRDVAFTAERRASLRGIYRRCATGPVSPAGWGTAS